MFTLNTAAVSDQTECTVAVRGTVYAQSACKKSCERIISLAIMAYTDYREGFWVSHSRKIGEANYEISVYFLEISGRYV